jgi:hypothetical protein
MNNTLKYCFISSVFFICGIVFFAYQESWIIINIPQTAIWQNLQKSQSINMNAQLWAFKNNEWIQETKQIIKTDDTIETVQNLLNSWFLFIEEELIPCEVTIVESVALSPTQKIAFISLSNNPFIPQATTYDCLMMIEGILKTIRENKIQLQSVQFLIGHKPWVDHRLNMQIAWPLTGYLNN